MIIRFSDQEYANLQIQHVARPPFCQEYLAEREEIWRSRLERVSAQGGTLWNGELYTLVDCLSVDESHLVMFLSTCEYKDVVFRVEKGLAHILTCYGPDHVPRWITVDCIPITQDGKFVFGIRHDGLYASAQPVGLIGGTVNRDEMEIVGLGDLWRYMQLEIEQETHLDTRPEDLTLFSLNAFRGKYEFLFTFQVPYASGELEGMAKAGEFSKLVAFNLTQVLNNNQPALDAFRYCKNFLHQLPEVATAALG